jgi:hypothetical protein
MKNTQSQNQDAGIPEEPKGDAGGPKEDAGGPKGDAGMPEDPKASDFKFFSRFVPASSFLPFLPQLTDPPESG